MGLDYNSARIFALTLSKRAIDDIRRDGLRQLRNYVDLCAFLAKHPMAQSFFEYAQNILQDPNTPYYTFARHLMDTVSEEVLCTVGVNIGFGSFLYGAEKLRDLARQGSPAFWMTCTSSEESNLASDVTDGEAKGSFLWSIHLKSPVTHKLLQTIAMHPKCTFLLFLSPELLDADTVTLLSAHSNIMVVVCLETPALSPIARQAFASLSKYHMLSAALVQPQLSQMNDAMNPCWLKELSECTSVYILSRRAGIAPEQSNEMRRQIWAQRIQVNGRLFLMDRESDLGMIDRHMPNGVSCRISSSVVSDMPYHPILF